MLRKTISSVAVATMLLGTVSSLNALVLPAAPAQMDKVTKTKTTLGYVRVNPYGNSPLSALIDLRGNTITDVHVKVHGKGKDGIPIEYDVSDSKVLTHDGIPVFGLYQNYDNTVTVTFKNKKDNKKYTHNYSIWTSAIENKYIDSRNLDNLPKAKIIKVDKNFKDKLFLTNSHDLSAESVPLSWAGQLKGSSMSFTDVAPTTGSMAFTAPPLTYITDTQGEIRWWLNADALYNSNSLDVDDMGYLMGIHETQEGNFTYLIGNNYGEFDLMGRVISKNRLPRGYIDASHEIIEMPNGNYLIRVAKSNYVRPDGDVVHTIRDHIIEITKSGNLVNVWDLNKSLDNLRDVLLLGLDQGAVCLNIDTSKAGQTVDEIEPDAPYGDVVGVGAGRNWAHVNSIEYDPKDDSIILSLRHQGIVKLSRDNKVVWILAAKADWKGELAKKVLTPVDAKGKKLNCDEMGVCENTDFDFSWTQHTAWLSPKGTLTVLDNGDGRGNTQPAMSEDKYTRYVEYKIDEKNMTVQQVWEYGKERGYDWFSTVTSNAEIVHEKGKKPYWYGFGGSVNVLSPKRAKGIHNIIDYDTKEVLVEIDIFNPKFKSAHYRGVLIEPKSIFSK